MSKSTEQAKNEVQTIINKHNEFLNAGLKCLMESNNERAKFFFNLAQAELDKLNLIML